MISVYYNGIILKDCVVKRFQQEVVRDESNTDVMYSRFIVTVEATAVEAQYQDLNIGDGYPRNTLIRTFNNNVSLVSALEEIHGRLSENRKDFWMILGGQTPGNDAYDREQTLLIASGTLGDQDDPANVMDLNPRYPAQGTVSRYNVVDVENGPQTEDIAIEQIFGGTAARVSVTFKIARSQCVDWDDSDNPPAEGLRPDNQAGAILSNRWQIRETKDAHWQTERTIEGTLRTRHADEFAQSFRHAVLPPIADGYQRVQQTFASDKTNTELRYIVVDKQRYASPPAPAVDWAATHTESNTANGTRQAANFVIKLTGTLDVDKRDLIAAAGRVLSLRIKDIQNKADSDDFHSVVERMEVIDELEKPTIEMRCTVLYVTSEYTWHAARVNTMCGGRGGNLEELPGYQPKQWPNPRAYDSDNPVTLLACYLQKPCSIWHGMPQDVPPRDYPYDTSPAEDQDNPYSPDTYEFQVERFNDEDQDTYAWMKYQSPGDVPQNNQENIFKFPYTSYEIATTWETSTGNLHLPYSQTAPTTPSEEDPDTAVALRMNRGISRLFYEITATRIGLFPTVPPINEIIEDSENNMDWTLLNHTITMRPPEVAGDGSTRNFGIAMKLIYGGTKTIKQNAKLNPGAYPINVIGASDQQSTVDLASITDQDAKIIAAPSSGDNS